MAKKDNVRESFTTSFDMVGAVLSYEPFQRLIGISKASHGKEFADWAKSDQQLWDSKFREPVVDLSGFGVRYLHSEECFFVRPSKINPYLANLEHKGAIYSQTIAGKYLDEHVDLRVYTRAIDGLGWCFTPALYWTNGKHGDDKKEDLRILCDLPLIAAQDFSKQMRNHIEQLGFKVDWFEAVDGLDGSKDEFGEFEYFSNGLTYSKNNVRFYII